ncbi:MAG: hypothetical protein H7Z41_02255 [Cytophagales bacterium]|nr:hypothetical protein [Armatimonadota bacterium]
MNSGRPAGSNPPFDSDDPTDDAFSATPSTLRRRRKRRRFSSTLLYRLRLIGMAVGGVSGAWLAFLFLQKVVHPYKLGNEVGEQVAVLRAQQGHQEQENAVLRERLLFLRSKEGAEVAARRAGFHRRGETVYLLPVTAPTVR